MCGLFTPKNNPLQHIEVYDYLSLIDEYGSDYTGLVAALTAKWKNENKSAEAIITSLLISLAQLKLIYDHDTNQDNK